jgi:hypothetical protein
MLVSGAENATNTNQLPTPRWNPPTAYTATYGHHAPLLRNLLKKSGAADLRPHSNASGELSPQSPYRSRNFKHLRPWTSNVFDRPTAYGAHYFASSLLKRSTASSTADSAVYSAASSVRGASSPPASPAGPALRPPPSPASSAAAAAACAPASPGATVTALDALRARFRPGGPRARFDAEFYHRDPTYTRDPGAETRFPRSGPRERQLRALFSPQPPPHVPPQFPGGGGDAAAARPPSAAASTRPAAGRGGGRVGLGLRSWHPTGPGTSLARSWSP